MSLKIWKTQYTESNLDGGANLWELKEYLKDSDKALTKEGYGNHRIKELQELVRQLIINSENILGAKS